MIPHHRLDAAAAKRRQKLIGERGACPGLRLARYARERENAGLVVEAYRYSERRPCLQQTGTDPPDYVEPQEIVHQLMVAHLPPELPVPEIHAEKLAERSDLQGNSCGQVPFQEEVARILEQPR